MNENNQPEEGLPDTNSLSEFPIGSPESRAAARRFLQSGSARILKYYSVTAARDDEGRVIGPVHECEPGSATLKGFLAPTVEFTRADNETHAEFEKRVFDNVPVAGPPGSNEYFMWTVSFHPRKDSPDQAA
jgi:hypothetical protein